MSFAKEQRSYNGGNFLNPLKLSQHNFNLVNSTSWNEKSSDLLKNRQYLESNRLNLTITNQKI